MTLKLKEFREKFNKTQSEIANILGITYQAYAHYEKGRRQPDIGHLIKLLEYYDTSIEELIGVEKRKPSNDTSSTYTFEEQELVELYRTLSPLLKNTTLEAMRAWAGMKSSQIDLHNNA